jgi:tape measure domain-containing protein
MAQVNIQYTADISQLNSKLDQIIQKQDQLISSSKRAGDEMVNSTKRAASETVKLESTLSSLQSMIASAFSVGVIINFTKNLVDAERRLELIQNRLNFVAGSTEKGTALFERLTAASNKLGINIEVLSGGFAAFGISATQAGFSARKAEDIFIKMSAGLRAAGATSLQSQRAFLALQQMIDKGVVSAEELRRQLAEALPGATSIMVEAYNNLHPAQQVTMEEFIKLQEAGKILSNEILPEFANVLEKRVGPALAGKQNSLDASLERVTTQFFLLKTAVTNADFVKFFTNTFGEHLKRINAIINSESVPAFEKLSRIMLEYMGLGKINSSVIERQMAKEQMAAAASAKINKDILDETERLMKLKKTARDEELKSLNEEAASYAPALEQAKKMNEQRDAEIATINQKFAALKKAAVGSNEAYGLEKQREKEVADVKAKYFNYEQSNTIKQKQTRVEVINGILQEVKSATEQELKAEEAKNKELEELEKQRLKNEVARLEKIRLEQRKGSAEELIAYTNVIKAKANLDAFSAKGKDEKALIMLKAEMDNMDAILEYQRGAQKQSLDDQIAAERERLANVEKGGKEELKIKSRIILLEAKLRAAQADLSQQEIDAILAEADSAVIELTKKFDDAAKAAADAFEKNKKKISDGIQEPFLDAIGKQEKDARDHYANLLALNKNNLDEGLITREEYNKNVTDLEDALQKEIENIQNKANDKRRKFNEQNIKEAARMVSRVASEIAQISQSFSEAERDIMKNNLDASANMLNAKLQAGLISEREYNEQINLIRKKQFKIDQDAAIAKVQIDTALAILNLFTQMNPFLALGLTPVIIGIADQQVTAIKSAPMPTFHDGGIDIGGDAKKTSGELKSDEFIAKLQRGESVIDRQDTRKYKDELSAIRDGRFEDYIASKYIIPAMERSQDRKQPASSSTSMEMAFQAAEMVNAIKGNKVIKLHKSSIKELTANSGTRSADKILARRSFR